MKPDLRNIDEVVKRYLPSASEERTDSGTARVLNDLRSRAPMHRRIAALRVSPSLVWRRIGMVAAAAAIVLAAFIGMMIGDREPAFASVQSLDGTLYRVIGDKVESITTGQALDPGDMLRSNGGAGGTLILADGSRVEMRSKSELALERTDGVRIRLSKGTVIVNAAKQHEGRHLYVQTRDVTVTVVGTVFLVNAEEEGSRVAVIEGEVRVKQGEAEKRLHPGEQVATNPSMPSAPVKEEVSWSRNADAHIALLLQSTAAANASPVTQSRESFDVASIRPYDPGAPTGARGGRVWAVGGCTTSDPQVNPGRFTVTGATLHALIVWAYGTRNAVDCREYLVLNLISGGPDWIRSDQWDVQAVIPAGSPGYTLQQLTKGEAPKLQAMLRTLLEDRFQLVIRREMKEVPAYALVLGKDAISQPASREVSSRIWNGSSYMSQWLTKRPEDWQPYGPGTVADERGETAQNPEWNGYFRGSDASMSDLVLFLGQKTGRPVLDRTGLAGSFNWFVVHSAEQPPNHSGCCGAVLNSGDRAYLFKAVEQLGLKVEDTRAAVEVLVIERVERPSGN